jgi:hypothetical protein
MISLIVSRRLSATKRGLSWQQATERLWLGCAHHNPDTVGQETAHFWEKIGLRSVASESPFPGNISRKLAACRGMPEPKMQSLLYPFENEEWIDIRELGLHLNQRRDCCGMRGIARNPHPTKKAFETLFQ